ncbi:AGAP005805-PA-like protein [Anopheles sinensis]|uniref:AGAP005805-PA-like protein n=1 Tax=Anopheles sinensis TaxID=74873 RepID=A0A084WDH7_ANOSI|nr:AGAP005805-PA-like protein [Anopheles sinensis]
MSETNFSHLSAARRTVPQLVVNRAERDLSNAFRVWTPSTQTQRLASESSRTLFVEHMMFRGDKKGRPFQFEVAAPEVNSSVPKRLATIVVEFLVENFNGGPEPFGLSCCQRDEFGSMLSTELHLLKIIDLQIESFWRRVVWCCSGDVLSFYECESNPNTNWKRAGVELKLAQLIEQQDPRYWELEDLEDTVKKAAPFVEHLSISQLMPFPSVEPLEEYEAYRMYNPPDAVCHHGSLAMLGHLDNLTSLSLVFGVNHWTKPYRVRYSKFSLADIENLAIALRKLGKLKSFTLTRSRMDAEKLATLVESFTHLPLESLDFSHCQLGNGCGAVLGRFLSRFGPTLKRLNLAGNRLDALELDQLCPGLAVYKGVVDKLDLSYNPIGAAGVLILGGALKGTPQLSELNFTGCLMGAEGSFRTIQLLSFHTPLRRVTLNCVPISPEGQRKLVQVLLENKQIEEVEIQECGLIPEFRTKHQMMNSVEQKSGEQQQACTNSIQECSQGFALVPHKDCTLEES